MAKRWWKKVEKATEKIGFTVNGNLDENEFDFAIMSPAGQDCHIEITATSLNELRDRLFDWCESYDVSYETYLWLDKFGHGTNGAPYDMKDCYDDMQWFLDKGNALWYELNKINEED